MDKGKRLRVGYYRVRFTDEDPHKLRIHIPVRQARLRRLIRQSCTDLVAREGLDATAVGLLLARTATADIADAHVVFCAKRSGQAVVTSDPGDIQRFAPGLRLVVV